MNDLTYDPEALDGRTVYSSDGEKLGKVDDVMVDADGVPVYVETKKGLFSGRRHVIPVAGLTVVDDDLRVAYTKEQLESAPSLGDDDEIDYDRERALGSHYGTSVRDWDERRDRLTGEDLSRGPTPETRHPHGGRDDVRDTTEGPTPETRIANRAADGTDDTAAGQPAADPRTRVRLRRYASRPGLDDRPRIDESPRR
jgi:sporulation protein YlmC with PRC-barrel domain